MKGWYGAGVASHSVNCGYAPGLEQFAVGRRVSHRPDRYVLRRIFGPAHFEREVRTGKKARLASPA